MIYIFWSCRDQLEAKKIIHGLLEKQLIACASIFPEITSIYRWEGNIEESLEVKVILKTLPQHFDHAQSYIQKECSYEVPEIVHVDIVNANSAYLSWVTDNVNI